MRASNHQRVVLSINEAFSMASVDDVLVLLDMLAHYFQMGMKELQVTEVKNTRKTSTLDEAGVISAQDPPGTDHLRVGNVCLRRFTADEKYRLKLRSRGGCVYPKSPLLL